MASRKPKRRRAHSQKVGLAPGAAVYTGTVSDVPVHAHVIDYNADQVREVRDLALADVKPYRDAETVTWIDFQGLHDAAAIESVCRHFGLHPLAVEDVLSPETRPKVDDYVHTLFLTLKMVDLDPGAEGLRLRFEHVALVLGAGWVLTFQERDGDPFDPVRNRIRSGVGRARSMAEDYLLNILLDAIVDGYFVALVALEDRIEVLEDDVFEGRASRPERAIHSLRGQTIAFRRAMSPLRVALASLLRDAPARISPEVLLYLRDVLDHLDLLLDRIESARERLTSTLEVHMAATGQKTNEVMQGLTVVATIFIPLTFIAGVYGMNFEWMPELTWWWSYPAVLALMAVLAVAMLIFMRMRGWLR